MALSTPGSLWPAGRHPLYLSKAASSVEQEYQAGLQASSQSQPWGRLWEKERCLSLWPACGPGEGESRSPGDGSDLCWATGRAQEGQSPAEVVVLTLQPEGRTRRWGRRQEDGRARATRRPGSLGKGLRTGTQNSTGVPSLLLGCWASRDFKASAQDSACSQTPVTSQGQAFLLLMSLGAVSPL